MTIPLFVPRPEDPATQCKACGATVQWTSIGLGAILPVDPDGTSHFRILLATREPPAPLRT